MIQHMVMLKFKNGTESADIDALEKGMDALPNVINEIQSFEFGRDIVGSDRSYDFGLVSLFANTEALQRYQVHPEHLKVLEQVRTICDSVITVDFTYAFTPSR